MFVAGPLPRRSGLTEVDFDAVERGFDVGPVRHFCALFPGEGLDEVFGLAAQRGRGRSRGSVGIVAVVEGGDQPVAAEALDEGDGRGGFARADDQIALPMTWFAAA